VGAATRLVVVTVNGFEEHSKHERFCAMMETKAEAISRRRRHRRALKRGNKRRRRVERTLRQCRHRRRCGTEACAVCLREFRLHWVGEAVRILIQRQSWTRCSIIPKGLLVPYKQLSNFDLAGEIKRIRKRLERSTLHGRVVLGALDISLNVLNNSIVGWQFHAYLIVEGADDKALRESIKDVFPPEPTAAVPYDFTEIDKTGVIDVVTYAYKSFFKRRSGYKNSKGNHHTKDQQLKGADLRELLPFLAKYKVGARLILGGVRRNGQRLVFTHKANPSIAAEMKIAA